MRRTASWSPSPTTTAAQAGKLFNGRRSRWASFGGHRERRPNAGTGCARGRGWPGGRGRNPPPAPLPTALPGRGREGQPPRPPVPDVAPGGGREGQSGGLARARAKIKPIAVCGDSSFFHTGVNGLMNVVENRVNIFIMVLDNSVTALTGYQPHPGTGWDAKGNKTEAVDIAEIARACHVPSVTIVEPDEPEAMKLAFRKGLTSDELSLVVVRKPCPLAKT